MPRPVKRSFTIDGHRTSISLEDEFWVALKALAKDEKKAVAQVVKDVDLQRAADTGLSSAVRVWILETYQKRAK